MLSWRCPRCEGELAVAGTRMGCRRCDAGYPCQAGVWSLAEGFRPAGFPQERHPPLASIEERHFWFGARDRLALRHFKSCLERPGRWTKERSPCVGGDKPRALDLGCGSGRFLSLLAGEGFDPVGVDGHREPLERAAFRCGQATLVHCDVGRLPFGAGQFDAAVALDVLEHVEPGPFLQEAARVVRPGGGLLVTVPAWPRMWSRMDELAGHRCRYTVGQLRRELDDTGWRLDGWTHYQFLLLPLVYVSRRLSRHTELPAERRPPGWLNHLLGWINTVEVRLLQGLRLPWGSSLVAWGRSG